MSKINKTPIETRLAIERRSAAMLPDRPTQAGFKPWDIRNALFSAIIADKGACLMGEIDRIVDETNAAIDAIRIKSGTLTVPMSHWKGEETPRAECVVGSIYTAGCAVLFMPEDDETKEQARLARLSMAINETVDGEWSDVVVFVGAGGTIPSVDLHFRYVVMPTESEEEAVVALVGVDAYGEGGGGTASGVDEEAVKVLIGKEVPEWARSKTKPAYTPEEVKARPATWTPTAEEIGARPSTWMPTAEEVGARPNTWMPTAADVKADPEGTAADEVRDHNEDSVSHTDIRLDITTIRTMLAGVIGTDTGKSMRAVAALVVAEIVGDASDSFDTLEEIAAWIEAHPNDVAAMVKRITDLEAAMGGKVSKTDIINTLDSTALDKPLSAAMGAKLNTMLSEMSDELDGKATPEQVAKAISDALAGYALKDHNHDGTYIRQTELNGAIDTALAEAKESGEFDGPKGDPYVLTESDIAEIANRVIEHFGGSPVQCVITNDAKIILTGVSVGTYTAFFKMEDGELVAGGVLTLSDETPLVSYKVTFVADGVTVGEVEYTEGDTELSGVPDVPAKDGYTGVWEPYDISKGGNITVDAVYTEIPADTYTVTKNPAYCTISGNDSATEGEAYTATVTANSGYEMSSIKVTMTMGGADTDITSSAVNGGNINIASVTGNIVITATATKVITNWIPRSTDENDQPISANGLLANTRLSLSSGSASTASGCSTTGFIPVQYNDQLYLEDITISGAANEHITMYKDEDGPVRMTASGNTGTTLSTFFEASGDGYIATLNSGKWSAITDVIAFIRISSPTLTENTILRIKRNGEWL